ncbi:MAG: glycosyltransferase family 4 protein [Acidobacteriaceae bacterium]
MLPARPDRLHRIYFKNAAARIGVSEMISEEYERRYGYPVQTIHSYLPFLRSAYGREELRMRHRVPDDDLVFLCLGTVKSFKGPDVLVSALERLGAAFLEQHRIRILFVGGGELVDPLRKRIGDQGLADRVHFVGKVPHERVHEYYALSDVFVIPSLAEARPLALSEALFNGLPAIGSDITVISSMIESGRNGLLFPKGDAAALADRIRTMVEVPDLRQRLADGARIEHDRFDQFGPMVERYHVLYDRLMSETGMHTRRRNAHHASG